MVDKVDHLNLKRIQAFSMEIFAHVPEETNSFSNWWHLMNYNIFNNFILQSCIILLMRKESTQNVNLVNVTLPHHSKPTTRIRISSPTKKDKLVISFNPLTFLFQSSTKLSLALILFI